ncbi:MAG: SDR family oxidoreductase [Planctomycetes bacterium]|nr:SDR family oxidoreductase [Planctomycetota bacterium]
MHSKNIPKFHLEGQVVLVTGSSRGLGKAIAFALGDAGAKVALNYWNDSAMADATFAQFKAAGYAGELFRGNVIDETNVNRMCGEIVAKLGPIDTLVINATPDQPHKPIEEYDWAFHQSMLDFFVKSPFLLTRATLAHMKEQRHGHIINITSEVFHRGVGNFSPYVAAKGAQIGWTRSMAMELAPWNITVNAVAPGWIPVERHANDAQSDKDGYETLIPMGNFGTPSDVGGAVVFLASDAARFITGQSIHVNGGTTVY